jgi:RNA polymerase sigma factor (sigma-70 family)
MLRTRIHTSEDTQLLELLSEGSGQAFDCIYQKYWSDVFNEAYKRLSNRDHAMDVAQEVFTSMWVRSSDRPIENLPAWLFTVTRNQVYRIFQTVERYVPLPDLMQEIAEYDTADARILEKELLKTYHDLIATLPDQQRIVFGMRYQESIDPNEIASRLNLSSKTVRNHIGRALMKLKTALFMFNILLMIHSPV